MKLLINSIVDDIFHGSIFQKYKGKKISKVSKHQIYIWMIGIGFIFIQVDTPFILKIWLFCTIFGFWNYKIRAPHDLRLKDSSKKFRTFYKVIEKGKIKRSLLIEE